MGWAKALFGRLTTMWSSNKSSTDTESSSSSYPQPVFAVDRTEVAVVATATGVPELTIRELNKATRSFSEAMLIGPGQNDATVVYRATLSIGNGKAAAAAKRLVHPPSGGAGTSWSAPDDELLRQQVLVLSRLRNDNVVRLLGYTMDATADARVLLFEFADMGTLRDVLHGPPPTGKLASASGRPVLSWSQRTGIALDVARGLEYLHDAAAMSHWGISSSKVLLFHGFRAKIADYDMFMQMQLPPDGNARMLSDTADKEWYQPPEYLMWGRRTSHEFDVYGYGVLLLELLTGRTTPYLRKLMGRAAALVREGRAEEFMDPKLGTHYPPDRAIKLARIALCCMQQKPESRPSMGDVAQMISCDILRTSVATMAK